MFVSTLNTSRPLGKRMSPFVRLGGPTSAGIGTTRHGDHVSPLSGEFGHQDRHRQAALGHRVEQRLAREGLAIDPQADHDQAIAIEPGDRCVLERSAPAHDRGLERRARGTPRRATVVRATKLDREVVAVLGRADAVGGQQAAVGKDGERREGRSSARRPGLGRAERRAMGDPQGAHAALIGRRTAVPLADERAAASTISTAARPSSPPRRGPPPASIACAKPCTCAAKASRRTGL